MERSLDSDSGLPIQISRHCSQIDAEMVSLYPKNYAADLIKPWIFTFENATPLELGDHFRQANISGITEGGEKIYATTIVIRLPGIFARGLARVRGREPLGTVDIEHNRISFEPFMQYLAKH